MLILAEESGEAVRARLNLVEEEERQQRDMDRFSRSQMDYLTLVKLESDIVHEVAQTGAMALRWLINHRSSYRGIAPQQKQSGVEASPEQRS